jgi:ABC-type nitrate/sulfonate/bicarbonate transport system permease component
MMTFARTLPLGAIILLVAVALVTSPVRAADTEVKIDNFTFNPQQITIKADTTVVKAFAIALAIAVSLGLLIGFALGLHRLSGDAMEPMLVALYSIPKITLYPIILLAFGIGISAKIAFGAIHGIVPVALFTLSAVRTIKPILIKTGRVLKLSPTGMVRESCCRGAGNLHRHSCRLFADADRDGARRNVRRPARPRLSTDECNQPVQH